MTAPPDPQCAQWIADDTGDRYQTTRRCSRTGTHRIAGTDRLVCTQHARPYDLPI